ncbi:LLM class flavin-dependent oxidoreductase [Streptomyces sp. NPDC098781]|uniref:LLM class flavin-dependent oxidoreductase n=1 Tax=Streptomyces sp. NPDC098781 TaxID=3366097 RepID=UPI003808BEAE
MTDENAAAENSVNDVVDPFVDRAATPMLNDENKFKLVLLSLNTARGTSLTHAENTLRVTWEETSRIARAADQAGIDAILSIAHWKNYARSRKQYDRVWDSLTFTAGLAAVTERIQFLATVHIPLFHPVMVAKMASTVDHIAGGRLALNVVAGWNQDAFAMFGLPEVEHDQRYVYAEEWMDLLFRVFDEDEPFDFHGRFLNGTGIVSQPKPLQRRPVIMSAGSSPVGMAFAAKYADINFGIYPSLAAFPEMLAEARSAAAEAGNAGLKFCGHGYIVCADTEAEAKKRFQYLMEEKIDRKSAEAFVNNSMGKLQSVDVVARERIVQSTAAGNWGFPLVGTPEQVVEGIRAMSDGGLDGMAVSFPDYAEGLARYSESIRPLLIEAGLRRF